MHTISVCMIVKNEEAILSRCLDCVTSFADEIIIVDTGSTDNTKEIAKKYTNQVFDFAWCDDFSAARNFSFSKASMEYIYVADADEIIDAENIKKIHQLKEIILPEIDVVQMYYTNQLAYGTTYNFDKELRPKLYKRLREFRWENPIHEGVALSPVVYDSDIEIIHMPVSSHAKRDFSIYQRLTEKGVTLSSKLNIMYAKELFIAGSNEDFLAAYPYFASLTKQILKEDELKAAQCVLVRIGVITKDVDLILKHALKNIADGKGSSEVCCLLGDYYYEKTDYEEAILWYYNAANETQCELAIQYGSTYPLLKLSHCYDALGDIKNRDAYKELAENAAP